MPRKKKNIKPRDIGVDPVYQSELLQRFINVVMWRGKKNAARKIVYDAVGVLESKFGDKEKALEIKKALETKEQKIFKINANFGN